MSAAQHHLIVGGQRSGKSRHAEMLAQAWLTAAPGHTVTVLATALAFDDEMSARIARHQLDRPAGFDTLEAPLAMAQGLSAIAAPGRLILVDCLTLWLTNWLMPMDDKPDLAGWQLERQRMLDLLPTLPSPVLFVSNEVGWGVSPMSSAARFYVDELGRLNQAVARRCQDLTLMVAGQAWTRAVEKEKR
ncbi:bifunctional adenosylcobinamide kinase/adenosylcobinamide-phosphate guanylyltransferase [Paucibacter sp. PLA-PC-4]|uniref:bifunctional adenosylcobinamide kinase/adenosylcobinamide-phosphate guanylyltransferase n=1 Tax=Paucibacter sp. PLA-PC-4 TaxID=2993655 RepID=UPI002248F246|nr:bifunctional adenosylcobinamide kinase/adenosylcobinamide-phosphate guanylyltransferase [Paucibacter sp. PLA-PC-4]MCX2863120.1 bifunctional adenosylcobinamide kinase/adenosylcobinamide-phosphate guanylyltransferase [Paucibacter sp. PLA-PC-4]